MLHSLAASRPDSTAVSFWARGEVSQNLSYQGLWQQACAAAHELQTNGLTSGDRILLALGTSPDFLAQLFGAMLAGGVPVPLAPPSSVRTDSIESFSDDLYRVATDCSAGIAVLDRRLVPLMPDIAGTNRTALRLLPVPARYEGPAKAELATPQADDTALIQYTSGSTRFPKGVELTHHNLLSNVAAIEQALGRRPDDVTVSWLPLYHDMGLIGTLLTSLYAAVPVVLLTPSAFAKHPLRWLQTITKTRGTISAAPNFAFSYLLSRLNSEILQGLELQQLRVILNGAEPIDVALIEAFETRLAPAGMQPGTVLPVYGLAESALAVAFGEPGRRKVEHLDTAKLESEQLAEPTDPCRRCRTLVSVGQPVPTQKVRIVDQAGNPLAERHIGEIIVRGPSVMKAYVNDPAATAKVLRDGWLYTGDLGYMTDGSLYITGRKRDIIIRHGRNHYPEDYETNVGAIEGVHHGGVAVFGIDIAADVQLVILAETQRRDSDQRRWLERKIREGLAAFNQIPIHEVLLLARGTLPRTTSGKVKRQTCRQAYLAGAFAP